MPNGHLGLIMPGLKEQNTEKITIFEVSNTPVQPLSISRQQLQY